ncbi:MAG: hypothetical protein HUN04_19980 [Desulfobacter sp.]|nr:MAG: hypothetical protein HUN04_19980 [Desulfobacter sp.]
MIQFIQVVPLTLFLILAGEIDTAVPLNWQIPFFAGGLAGAAAIGLILYNKSGFDRIFLGINSYLITGALAFATGQYWLNNFYGRLGASGMLLWVLAIGIITMVVSPGGFIGSASADERRIKKYSFLLLLIALCAFCLSYGFQGHRLLSEILPFGGLLIAQNLFKSKLTVLDRSGNPGGE